MNLNVNSHRWLVATILSSAAGDSQGSSTSGMLDCGQLTQPLRASQPAPVKWEEQ